MKNANLSIVKGVAVAGAIVLGLISLVGAMYTSDPRALGVIAVLGLIIACCNWRGIAVRNRLGSRLWDGLGMTTTSRTSGMMSGKSETIYQRPQVLKTSWDKATKTRRVEVALNPGKSITDLSKHHEAIAAHMGAHSVTVEPVSSRHAGIAAINIHYRDPLADTVKVATDGDYSAEAWFGR